MNTIQKQGDAMQSKKMNPEVKARWVAALRSGEYAQGTAILRSKQDEFCCLGVLCDLAAKDGLGAWDADRHGEAFVWPSKSEYISHDVSLLPNDVREWAGIETKSDLGPLVEVKGLPGRLALHNDDGRTFAEIADAIEGQL